MLIVDGFHVPLIPLVEMAGNSGAVLFWQTGLIGINTGFITPFITISIVTGVAH